MINVPLGKTIQLGEVFREVDLRKAKRICYNEPGSPHRRLCEEVVKPVLNRINRVTGQENDPDYWAYALEYAFNQTSRKGSQ